MVKKLTQEEFQEFMIEQVGALQNDIDAIGGMRMDIDNLVEHVDALHTDLNALRTEMREGFSEVRRAVDKIERTLTPLCAAVDKDAETIVEHDRRLTRIEESMELRHA